MTASFAFEFIFAKSLPSDACPYLIAWIDVFNPYPANVENMVSS